MMTYDAHVNVMSAMLYERGDRTSTPGIRTVTRRQIQNVVARYNDREHVMFTVREMCRVNTTRWSIEPTMQTTQFLISQKYG